MGRDAVVPDRGRRSAKLDRVPGYRVSDVHGGVHHSAGRQRTRVLRGDVLIADALGHQSVHHEHGCRRPAHDSVLRALLVRRHALVAVLAVWRRPLSHRQFCTSCRRFGMKPRAYTRNKRIAARFTSIFRCTDFTP